MNQSGLSVQKKAYLQHDIRNSPCSNITAASIPFKWSLHCSCNELARDKSILRDLRRQDRGSSK
jgi:hypothetical protein